MIAPERPEPWPDLLAAYVDGELSADDRCAVEQWLAAHPRAREEARAQWKFSPENWRLWQKVEPPLPHDDAWAVVQERVAKGVAGDREAAKERANDPVRRDRVKRTGLFLAWGLAAAAAILVGIGLLTNWGRVPTPEVPGPTDTVQIDPRAAEGDPLAGLETLAIAQNDDVVIERVEGDTGEWLPVGGPLVVGPIRLVSSDEIELEDAEEHPAWPEGGPRLNRGRGDAPMIFAAGRR